MPRTPSWATQLNPVNSVGPPPQDLIIPSLKPPEHYIKSPLLGHPPVKRDILLYMRGDMGPWRHMCYSRGIRQRLAKWVATAPHAYCAHGSALCAGAGRGQ